MQRNSSEQATSLDQPLQKGKSVAQSPEADCHITTEWADRRLVREATKRLVTTLSSKLLPISLIRETIHTITVVPELHPLQFYRSVAKIEPLT